MKLFLTILKALGLRKEPTVEMITKPMGKIVAQLNDFAAVQFEAAKVEEDRAEALKKTAEERKSASVEAEALAKRYMQLTA